MRLGESLGVAFDGFGIRQHRIRTRHKGSQTDVFGSSSLPSVSCLMISESPEMRRVLRTDE